MKSTTKRIRRDYSLSLKLADVDQIEKGEMPYKQTQQNYRKQGRSTALIWLSKHGRLIWSSDTLELVK